jgi:hypothetical protein
LSALGTGRLYPRRNPWYSLFVAESAPGHMVLSVATEKIPSDTTGNRARDRPSSSTVPFDVSLVIYINSTNISPIMIMSRMYENQNLLSLFPSRSG